MNEVDEARYVEFLMTGRIDRLHLFLDYRPGTRLGGGVVVRCLGPSPIEGKRIYEIAFSGRGKAK